MTLRFKFVIPINLILVGILASSLAWEWWRLERSEFSILRTRLDEEARFVQAAADTFGVSSRFGDFLQEFCHATDAIASPEHQVTVVGPEEEVIASAAAHVHHPIDPVGLASLAVGSWLRRRGDESYLIQVSSEGDRRVVVAESTRLLRERVHRALIGHAAWILSLGVFLLVAINTVMRRAVLRPIRRLHPAALRLEQGQLAVQVDWSGSDELGALSQRFNAMSRTLANQAEDSRRELDAARRVQSHSLPPPCFDLGGVQIAGRCIQRGPVGGDIYDAQLLPGNRVAILIADLSGHDVSAALNTAMLRAIVWREAEQADSPAEVLARLNQQLCRDLPAEHFASAVFAWFDPTTGRLHYANAGHPTSYFRSDSMTWRELESSGPVLRLISGAEYSSLELEVVSGSRLFVCTDGVTEAFDPQGRLWGTRDLLFQVEEMSIQQTPTAKEISTGRRPMNPKTSWWLTMMMVGIGFALVAILAHWTGTDGAPGMDAGSARERALAIREDAPDEEPSDLASTPSNLATLYMGQGRYFEAEALYRRTLAIHEEAKCCIETADCCRSRGKDAGPEATCKRCLAMDGKGAGTDPAGLVETLKGYASLLRRTGRAKEAEKLEVRAKVIRERQGPVDAPKP